MQTIIFRITFYFTSFCVFMPSIITFYTANANDDYFLPKYYDTYLANKAATIEALMRAAGEDGISFIFITDEHAPQYSIMRSPEIIHRLSELVHLPTLISGGDVDQTGQKTNEFCDALRKNFNGTILHAVGNHDFLNQNL